MSDRAMTKAELALELEQLRRRVRELETADGAKAALPAAEPDRQERAKIAEPAGREVELRKLNRTLKAHSRSARAMIRATNEADYLREVCMIVVEDCGHAMVWIGFAEDDAAKTIRPVAYSGFEKGYLETLKLTWADTERGRGPGGTAIRTGKPSSCANMLTDPAFAPWREEALKRGYASSLVLPLTAGGKTFGEITIYERKPDAFSEDETELLSDLADDLAFGITALRIREAHARMEDELRSLALFPSENPGPVIRISKDGTILYANKAADAMLAWWGCRAGDRAPEPMHGIVRHVLDSGLSRETDLECGDRVFSLVLSPIADRGYVTVYGSDATDRKRLEQEVLRSRDELEARVIERTRELGESTDRLRESSELLERMFSSIRVQLAYMDRDFNFIRVNRAYAEQDGLEPEFFTGKNHFALHPGKRMEAVFRNAVETGRSYFAYEEPHDDPRQPERGTLYRDWNLLPVKGPDGAVRGLVLSLLDVTDRKRAQLALAESERKFRAIFDNAFQFIGLIKPDGTVLEVNQTALRFAEIALQDAVGRPLWEASWWRAAPAAQKQLKEAVAEAARGRLVRYETALHGAGDSVIAADFSINPVLGADGETALLIVEARDITEHKRLEQEVLEVSNAERRRFGQDLHDGLGQQLAGIALLSRALQQRLAAREARAAEEARTIMDLANQAAAQSRALARGLCPVELTEDGLIDALRELAANTEKIFGIPCELRCEPPALVADSAVATHLYYIAQEAVNNAVKHSRAGTITVSLGGGPGVISLRVRDDGVGMPEHADQTNGLGLRTMRYRADAIGAFLDIRSVPPRGTIVRCFVRSPKAEAT